MKKLFSIVNDCMTGIDGKTYDPSRIYGGLAVLTFLFLSVYTVVFNKALWNAQDFGIGFGALLVGFGLGVSVKSKTEPEDEGGGTGK